MNEVLIRLLIVALAAIPLYFLPRLVWLLLSVGSAIAFSGSTGARYEAFVGQLQPFIWTLEGAVAGAIAALVICAIAVPRGWWWFAAVVLAFLLGGVLTALYPSTVRLLVPFA